MISCRLMPAPFLLGQLHEDFCTREEVRNSTALNSRFARDINTSV